MLGQEERARAVAGVTSTPSKEYLERTAREKADREEKERSLEKYILDMEILRLKEENYNLRLSGTPHRLR